MSKNNTHPLMVPRYKVIGTYPVSESNPIVAFEQGAILLNIPYGTKEWYSVSGLVTNRLISEDTIKEFPHLFQLLPWYTDRKVEELPKYLKSKAYPLHVVEIFDWVAEMKVKGWEIQVEEYEPATEQEYITSKGQNK